MTINYDNGQIRVLEGLEAVRARPGMYIGSTGTQGLHHLVYEVVDNSIEEVLAGHCKNIDISINVDGSVMVSDDGRGIEDNRDGETDKLSIENIFTTFHVGKYRDYDYRIGGGLYGVGLAVVSALSSSVEVKVWRDQKIHSQRFERGIAVSELEIVPSEDERTGTTIAFLPDAEIFTDGIEFDFALLAHRFRELAYLNAGLRMSLIDRRLDPPKLENYYYPEGLRDFVSYINADKQPLQEDIFYTSNKKDEMWVEVALQWCMDDDFDCVLSYANTTRTMDNGQHIEGLNTAITRTINTLACQRNKLPTDGTNLAGNCIRSGLTAIVSVLLPNTEWAGPTRTCLANSEVKGIVDSIVGAALTEYLTERPNIADAIIDKAMRSAETFEIARRERRQNQVYPSPSAIEGSENR
jgi:DNA gyrase subunit B